ncbi:MAG TPA: 2-isopropylmalate synthase [Candidatus Cybelea sp.]|nr:2-isopropylmalate synthase [Candidatus Cybelea sp.]
MPTMPIHKYRAFTPINLPDRRWPTRVIDRAPIWCSVDLRDGNQALVEPMDRLKKLKFFEHLVKLGFKEIEVGFPAASETDFDFIRHIIEHRMIPDDVTIQVLTQAREPLIQRTMESIEGSKNAILHLYNSTSTLQRRVVFDLDREGVKNIALDATKYVKSLAPRLEAGGTNLRFQYSPESFTGTELDYALDVCHGVMDIWQPTEKRKIVFNLPATVEMASPNIYADQIEWMHRNFKEREKIILSLHPHNDRGTAVAATELGVMAGAERIEGTLFGNGERTGNVDIVTLALNMFSQGVDPKLDFRDINSSIEVAEYCNQLPVHQRHPYAGELVYTAFSGSHQDAIKKGMTAMGSRNSEVWEVPYLPIDPKDVGRSYEAIIRVNSQSGKGGVAYLLHAEYGIDMPRELQIEFSQVIQEVADATGKEIVPEEIWRHFRATYLDTDKPYRLNDYRLRSDSHASEIVICSADIAVNGKVRTIEGRGNGPIDAFIAALKRECGLSVNVMDYHQDAIGHGSGVNAVCFIRLDGGGGNERFGVGIHANTVTASLKAIVSGVNRLQANK